MIDDLRFCSLVLEKNWKPFPSCKTNCFELQKVSVSILAFSQSGATPNSTSKAEINYTWNRKGIDINNFYCCVKVWTVPGLHRCYKVTEQNVRLWLLWSRQVPKLAAQNTCVQLLSGQFSRDPARVLQERPEDFFNNADNRLGGNDTTKGTSLMTWGDSSLELNAAHMTFFTAVNPGFLYMKTAQIRRASTHLLDMHGSVLTWLKVERRRSSPPLQQQIWNGEEQILLCSK